MPNPPNAESATPDAARQPLLHDLVNTVLAPTCALSEADGQIHPSGVQGLFHADTRVLSQARLLVDEREPTPISYAHDGPGGTRFVCLVRWLGDPIPDPTVRIDRARRVTAGGMSERIEVVSTATEPVRAVVTLELSCDLAPMDVVRSGGAGSTLPATAASPDELSWGAGALRVAVTADAARLEDGGRPRLVWPVELAPRGKATLNWHVRVADPHAVVVTPDHPTDWARPQVTADDHRLVRLLRRSLDDLHSLRLAEPTAPGDTFLGAGVPWFLTLFGRDSIWAARMLLPLGTDLAAGTLRVLARRQGRRLDARSDEAPGKIMHELRRDAFDVTNGPGVNHANRGLHLPATYYGTVDATPLWISLLHDAWRWGLPETEVETLLPHLEAALGWLADHSDIDGDGFIEYLDISGQALANQGWKDSADAVRFRDGRQATPPIALAEVQGYAYQAALHGAALLDAFARPGGQRWCDYAAALAEKFRARYWVNGPLGSFPALGLDRDKRPVDALTSNIGHLLGTGILSAKEEAAVADALGSPAMADGFGLRTMSAADDGFNPLSYHCGSIWAHDTAIVLSGLARAGFDTAAAHLADGLLTAAEAFDFQLPELFGGDARDAVGRPVPYPASCRPQAWSAAAAVTIIQSALGLYPDVPGGQLRLRPLADATLGAITAHGIRVAGTTITAAVDRNGHATVQGLPASMKVKHD